MRLFILILCLLGAQIAAAQVGLPSVRVPIPGAGLPSLPRTDLPLESNLDAEFRGTDLRGLRALQIRTLLRAHRDVIEADPHGNPIVRGEVLAVAPSATMTSGRTTSIWRKRNGEQVFASSGSGVRLPGGRHFTMFAM